MSSIVKRFIVFWCSALLLLLAAAHANAVTPQSGWWWNPNEGGRGYTIEAQNNTVFMAGYMYDPSGRATWYAAGPTAMAGSTFTAPLTTYLGGQTLTGTYRPTTGTISNGNISVTFSDATHGTITWPNGTTTAIERFNIVVGGVNSTPAAGTPQAGWWWSAAEGGRGYTFEIQNGMMFMAAYMYDDSGNPIWYVAGPTQMNNPLLFTGQWQQYGNGQTLTGTYKAASITNTNVGSVTVTFNDAATGTLTLPNGATVQVERFAFDAGAIPNYAGNYSGTYGGSDTGTFNVSISKAGVISGTFTSSIFGFGGGVLGTIAAGGGVSMIASGQAGSATYVGSINVATGALNGSWTGDIAGQEGTFVGNKK